MLPEESSKPVTRIFFDVQADNLLITAKKTGAGRPVTENGTEKRASFYHHRILSLGVGGTRRTGRHRW